MEILESEIIRLCRKNELDYIKNNQELLKVEYLNIICYEDDTNYYVDAQVNQKGHENHLAITINQEGEVEHYECFCPYCNDDHVCAHIAYVMRGINKIKPRIFPYKLKKGEFENKLAILEGKVDHQKKDIELRTVKKAKVERKPNYLETLSYYEKYKRERMLEESRYFMQEQHNMMKQMIVPKIKKDIKLKLCYENTQYYYSGGISSSYIRLRIGKEKSYLVKNIESLLEAIKNEYNVKYGKELEFIHYKDSFDDASKLIIDYLIDYTNNNYMHQKKEIVINEDTVDAFDSLLQKLPEDYYDFDIKDFDIKIGMSVEKNYDYDFYLTNIYTDLYVSKQGFYSFKGNAFYRCVSNDMKTVASLYLKMYHNNMLVANEDIQRFVSLFIKPYEQYFEIENNELLPNISKIDYMQLYADIDDLGMIDVSINAYLDDGNIVKAFKEEKDLNLWQLNILEDYIKDYSSFIDYDLNKAYINFNTDLGRKFVMEGLVYLHNYCEVYVSDALKRLSQKTKITMKVGVSIKNDLLHIDISSMDLNQDEIYDVLKAYKRKKKFHRLKDGRLIDLQDEGIEEANQMLDDLNIQTKDLIDGNVKVPVYRSFHMQDMDEETNYLEFDFRDDYKAYLERFKEQKKQEITIPPHYENVLRDYQKDGYRWLKVLNQYHFNGILADEMGLGKTLQVICLLESEKENGKTSLVIAPSSLLYNWDQEIKKFSKDLVATCISGNQETRKLLIDESSNYDIIITTYDYLRRDIDYYEDKHFKYIVIDEAQYIKNPKTKNAQCVKRLKGDYRLALTGTPIENSLAELWSIFDFLMPGYLFNYHYFSQTYEKPIVALQDEKQSNKLKKLVEPFILRRLKQDVLNELPDKTERVYPISFNEEEERLYIANLAQVNADLANTLQMDQPNKILILSMLTRLRQICCEPRVLFDNINTASSKLKSCMELLTSMKQAKQKALLFSSFTSVLDLIAIELERNHISYAMLTGSTSKEKRKELVEKFQNGLYDVFLISLKAGGTGLNLTAASNVIHYDPWWNVSAQNQATDRAHRIGQQNKVTVYKLIMKNSIEEKIQVLQTKKKQLSDAFVEGNEGSINDMSFEDIVSLFEM